MSAFGQAGFGSRNRQNQLRAQGQMDLYGNQVRQARQAPTFNIYSQQSQPAPSSRPATPRPQPASMPAYGGQPQTGGPPPMRTPGVNAPANTDNPVIMTGGPAQLWTPGVNAPPATGGPMPTMGQAQPIPPASTGTSTKSRPKETQWSWAVNERDTDYLKQQLRDAQANLHSNAGARPGGAYHDEHVKSMRDMQDELARRGVSFDPRQEWADNRRTWLQDQIKSYQSSISDFDSAYRQFGDQPLDWQNASNLMRQNKLELAERQRELEALNAENPVIMTGGPGVMRTPGVNAPPDDDNPAIMTGGPAQLWNPGVNAPPATGGPMPTMGQAQPVPPASTGNPYGGPPRDSGLLGPPAGESGIAPRTDAGYQQRVDAAAQQWAGTPAGSQQRDWAGNGMRNRLQRMGPGESFGGMTQAAREWAGSLSSGPPAPRRDNETAAEASARLDAEMAYARQQEVLGRIAETEKRERQFATRVIDPASLPQNQPGYNPFPGGVTFADFWGPNAMQAQSWHRNYNPDGSKRIIGWGGGGIGVAPQPIYAR